METDIVHGIATRGRGWLLAYRTDGHQVSKDCKRFAVVLLSSF